MNKKPKEIKKSIFANMRACEKVLMISVCEGDGTMEYPKQIVRYIVAMDGSILGKVNQDWINLPADETK